MGNVDIATLITAANQQSTAYTFTVDAAGGINVSGAINLESSSSGGTTNRASMSVVLTAAGIAGFILSVGLAVDANILIAERMKEELRSGKNAHTAITDGFKPESRFQAF